MTPGFQTHPRLVAGLRAAFALVAALAVMSVVAGCGLILGSEPNAPVSLALELLPTGEVRITWIDASNGKRNEDGFRIERRLDVDGSSFEELGTAEPDTQTYDDARVTAGISYWYRVVAFNGDGDSGVSAEAQITTADLAGDMLIANYIGSNGPTGGTVVDGDWNVPNFNHNGGIVTFPGGLGLTSTINGSNTFAVLHTDHPGKIIRFAAGQTQTVLGCAFFEGDEVEPVVLQSTEAGTQWTINNIGDCEFVEYAMVQDSNVEGGTMGATSTVDLGNNDTALPSGWEFN